MKSFTRCFILALAAIFVFCAVCFGCASAPKPQTSLLPLQDGWYQYDFARTYKGIEDEFDFKMLTGMSMIQELVWKYSGVVCRFEDGALYDPVTGIELLIDKDGSISCAENISIKGKLEKDGRFFWSGLREEHGRLNSILVKGSLLPLPPSVRGGREYDGVYQMTDTGTGKKQIVKISDGFYTWKYADKSGNENFTPWPTLIKPDGTFSFSMDLTTIMEMTGIANSNFSTISAWEGKVIPEKGISMEEATRSSGVGADSGGSPQVYAGTMIRSGEYSNEEIPGDIEALVRSGRAAVKAEPKPNRAQYPSWYLRPPAKDGFLRAAGEKTFKDEDIALTMAEVAAAANLIEQLRVRIESEIIDKGINDRSVIDERIRTESAGRFSYEVVEKVFNKETSTGFVLVEMEL